jgi:hypothetical protein
MPLANPSQYVPSVIVYMMLLTVLFVAVLLVLAGACTLFSVVGKIATNKTVK